MRTRFPGVRIVLPLIVVIAAAIGLRICFSPGDDFPEERLLAHLAEDDFYGPPIPSGYRIERFEGEIQAQSTLRDLLFDYGFTPQELHNMIVQTREVYNLNRVAAGNRFAVEMVQSVFKRFEYDVSEERYLIVSRRDEGYEASMVDREIETVVAGITGRIKDNLWNTLLRQGESGQLVMSLYEVLQWDIDFFALQPEDSFRVLLEKKYCEGAFLKYGEIQAIEFNHGGKTFHAFVFRDPDTKKRGYYDSDGKGVKKAFLKAPFRYDYRISSGFSYSRLHPVLKKRRPHYGVDYAAPYGTPVLASASGRVIFAGRNGANGKYVKIRHTNGFVTYYLHLSKILVRSGRSVAQGDRIGLVGATGLATGPHLDYRIQDKRGRFINPRKFVALPSDSGVKKRHMKDFIAVRDALLHRLESVKETPQSTDLTALAG